MVMKSLASLVSAGNFLKAGRQLAEDFRDFRLSNGSDKIFFIAETITDVFYIAVMLLWDFLVIGIWAWVIAERIVEVIRSIIACMLNPFVSLSLNIHDDEREKMLKKGKFIPFSDQEIKDSSIVGPGVKVARLVWNMFYGLSRKKEVCYGTSS